MTDELRLLRRRETEQRLDLARSPDGQLVGNPAFTGIVYNGGSMPTGLPAIVFTNPVRLGGNQTEGAIAAPVANAQYTIPVAVFGTRVPIVGEILEAYYIDGRWCAWVGGTSSGGGGGGGVIVGGCPCTVTPITITMSVTNSGLNNGIFNNDTIVYGPTPAAYMPGIVGTANSWLGSTIFTDLSTGLPYQYYLFCNALSGSYVLTRIFTTNFGGGGPFRDSIRYTWSFGFGGNTCTPFLLTNGTIFTGGDARTVVTLSG